MKNIEKIKQSIGFKPFYTIGIDRTLEIVGMVKQYIQDNQPVHERVPFGIQNALGLMVQEETITLDESKQVLFALFNYGVQHGKIEKDIDPTFMYWFDPYYSEERLFYLDYFYKYFGKEANHEATND